MKTALSIAGSDSSGGAGIQADLKTMTMNGVYAMSAITALTAQNTTGVSAILDVTPHFLQQQIDAVFTDIPPDAVKIGMVSSAPLIQTIARCLRTYQAANIVVDPVMVATSGARLLDEDAVETLTQTLLPLADLLTPNLPEAEVLSGCSIQTEADMVTAARRISQTYHCAVLCKGGHSVNDANDLLYADGTLQWFRGRRIANSNTHGTGCTLSSAIAANLAKGFSLPQAVQPQAPSLESREAEPRTVTLPKAQLEDLNLIRNEWGKIVREMGMSIRPSFRETVVEPAGDSCLCIVFSDAMNFSMGSRPSILGDLERHVEQAYGKSIYFKARLRENGERLDTRYITDEELRENIHMDITIED